MDIAPYINDLLNRDQLVYVPGLGSFFTRRTPGVYNQQHQKFYPPVNTIDFLQENREDHELRNYISSVKNISPQAASYFIEKYVDQLLEDEKLKNRSIKEALLSDSSPFAFENARESKINNDNFGLPDFTISPLKKPIITDEPVAEHKPAPPERDYVENFYREFSQNIPEVAATKSRKPFWVGLIFLLTICLLGCYALYLYYPAIFNRTLLHKNSTQITASKPVITPDTLKKQPPASFDKSNPPTTYTPQAGVSTNKKTVSVKNDLPAAQLKTDAERPINDADIVERQPYEIIGAAFKTLTGAKNFVHQLKNRGMVAHILKPVTGRPTMVTFGSFNDKDSAKTALQKLHAKDVHSEAYIQHYNK